VAVRVAAGREGRLSYLQQVFQMVPVVSEAEDGPCSVGVRPHEYSRALEELEELRAKAAERDQLHAEATAYMTTATDLNARLRAAEAEVSGLRLREPTQSEGAAAAAGASECFVGGWTGRRCCHCRTWTWGGPTACVRCVARENERRRCIAAVESVLAEVTSRDVGASDDNSAANLERVLEAIRSER
jgi:hypothetical protein